MLQTQEVSKTGVEVDPVTKETFSTPQTSPTLPEEMIPTAMDDEEPPKEFSA